MNNRMVDTVLVDGDVVTDVRVLHGGYVAISNDKIVEVGSAQDAPPDGTEVVSCRGKFVFPGLVDVQVNGGGGAMFSTSPGDETAYREIAAAHAALGTTSMCPTVISGPRDDMCKAVSTVAKMRHETGGSRFLGSHIEGPFLADAKRGGHAAGNLRMPSREEVASLIEDGKGYVAIVTLAPELDGCISVIRFLVDRGVRVSAGHSAATSEVMYRAIDAGLAGVTHMFNGMGGLTSRDPGIAGVCLSNDQLTAGLIGDLLHVSRETLRVAIRAKSLKSLYVTTDAVSPMGTSGGSFDLYGTTVTVRNGGCYTSDGVLAGTATPLLRMVRNLREEIGLSLVDAVGLASAAPADFIGQASVGRIRTGCFADLLVVLSDWELEKVILSGTTYWTADGS